VTIDVKQAFTYFERACDRDGSLACFNLAEMYFEGTGVAKDEAKATLLMEKACKLGNGSGCLVRGNLLGTSRHFPTSSADAISTARSRAETSECSPSKGGG